MFTDENFLKLDISRRSALAFGNALGERQRLPQDARSFAIALQISLL
jgi:hypothetical protein